MRLYSTNGKSPEVSFEEAVFKGLPSDNGLFMPKEIKPLPNHFFEHIEELSFQEIAFEVTQSIIGDDIPSDDLQKIINEVLSFDAPVVNVHDNIHTLELFHGPTLAFKDFGARFMSRIMGYFLQEKAQKINILVATSGDTGSAVAQGFLGVPNINVTILYPKGKVSEIQEMQLTTNGQNIKALEIEGTFDDCQRMVKSAFLDEELSKKLGLSSANSINISRLIPQSFYYFYAYAQLKKQGKPVVFCVPSGNFGNLCGGLIAQKMGLPVHKFIAATNANDIVPTYLKEGKYEPKPSVQTISNAMDVGAPSNFARMQNLYEESLEAIREDIIGKSFTDEQTKEAIKRVFNQYGYILDPHGAVGYLAVEEYLKENPSEDVNTVFLETAHPCKFGDVVEPIIGQKIDIPQRLQEIVDREKQSTLMDANFESLKSYLLNENAEATDA
ncbi:threonine synthase [Aureibacter tunicatorum]|uniref:Threonine synthase n=1 Tax=Aureibacter tunicatorum TaxID=866807 RepID=A0AAE3XIG8_9BACT|nr:threonine synthase [Aureibacter tunicatorum]MDR6237348.1 threonine synthase [Aureibacter tunicatorum]BDD06339.1 threonine synthase [Aureibacter tunicatorum]